MKKNTAKLVVVLLLFILFYQTMIHYEINLSQSTFQQFIRTQSNKNVKKVAYAEGEYEKEVKKWKSDLQILFDQVTENMNFSFEQIVFQNYIQYSKKYTQIGNTLTTIEPPSPFQKIHQSMILETTLGAKLCEAYLNRIDQFDPVFVQLFKSHSINNKLLKDY